MSKIPIDRNGKLRVRSMELREAFLYSHTKMKSLDSVHEVKGTTETLEKSDSVFGTNDEESDNNSSKKFAKFIPNLNVSLNKMVERNPRISDLREKLNKINNQNDRGVDKETKRIINDIKQKYTEKKEGDESGPYSLLFELDNGASSSLKSSSQEHVCRRPDLLSNKLNKSVERLPNVLNFEDNDKKLREFEYSCENEVHYPIKPTLYTHSRSDLCLQLKSYGHSRNLDSNRSPNDNSLSKTNEENSLDDSLGILTPDQMDDMCYLENAFSPTVEGLPMFCDPSYKTSPDNGDTPSTDKTESNSAASAIQNDVIDKIGNKNLHLTNVPIIHVDKGDEAKEDVWHRAQKVVETMKTNEEKRYSDGIKDSENIVDEEFMPSIHSSILEPISSVAETTVNLDLPLDCREKQTHRVEQTPSPEDLPLDNSDITGEVSTYSQFSASTVHDSQTYSENKNDYQKSMETSKVSNSFITSITSITSLDGYQGDGEMSRPVSRSADHSMGLREDAIEMDWQNVPVTRRTDPMTDSDFFTESDADGLDENMQRGDRRAQVIDGALYGGKNGNSNPPLMVNRNDDSCMDSSGVYTDFENHRTSPVFLNVIDDMSPEGSTLSTHSELSQKNIDNGSVNIYPVHLESIQKENKETSNKHNVETPQNSNSLNCEKNKDEKRSFTLKKYKMPKRDVPSKLKSMLLSRKPEPDASTQSSPRTVKKTDRRENLMKKNSLELKNDYKTKSYKDIKSKVDSSFSLQRSQTACSVTRMLSAKSTNTNTKPKSRHMRMRIELNSAHGSGKSSLHSSQSDLSATSTPLGKPSSRFPLSRNGKKRESVPTPPTPARAPAPTPPAPTPAKKNGVVQKLSASPVPVRARNSLAPPPSPRKPPNARRTPAPRPTTLPANKEPPRVTAAVGSRGKRVQTPQAARTPPAPLTAQLAAPLPTATREQTAALAHAAKGVEALGVLVQYLVFRLDALNGGTWKLEAEKWRGVAAAERSSAARADRNRQQRAQKDLDTIAECLSKISELEMEVSTKEDANARLQSTHMEEVNALANDIKGLKETIETLKREVGESRARLHAHSEIERTLRAQLEAARKEITENSFISRSTDWSCDKSDNTRCHVDASVDTSCETCDAACDPLPCDALQCELRLQANDELSTDATELAAEVRSLRAVIELKQAEMASLRDAHAALAAERERRAAAEREARTARHAAEELKERALARQRESDRLRDDNRRLRDAAARDRDHAARLAALNEELRYKLRQKSQVVSLLAGGGYVEHTRMRARTSSGESARSSSPAPDSPPSRASSPATPAPPAVKGVVEKHDSVSWVLEIEESPEEVATRLARRSSFRTGGSQSPSPPGSAVGTGAVVPVCAGGVKRRGGSSPPAPAAPDAAPAHNAHKLFRSERPPPPPLKESAGEAIYIYDDTDY